MIKISVIIPTYCPQDYLWQCLLSLRHQTFPQEDFEIILILNGEKEPYYSKIQDFVQREFDELFHVRLLYSDWGNVSNARNMALDIAKGEYVAFIDDDDYVSPSYLEELYDKADKDTISLCYPYAFKDGKPDNQLEYSITREYNRCSLRGKQNYMRPKKFFSGPCMKLIHRNIIGNRRFDTRFKNGEDSLFMFLISDRMHLVDFTSKDAVYYRRYRVNSAITSLFSVQGTLNNCYQMFRVYSVIYFGGIHHYHFCRYIIAILGLCHIVAHRLHRIFWR